MTRRHESFDHAGLPMFGQVLFEIRTGAGMSLGELAKRSQFSKGRLSQLENSRVGAPSLEAIDRLACALQADDWSRKRLIRAATGERRLSRIVFGRNDPLPVRELAAHLRACAERITPDDARRLMAAWEGVRLTTS